MLAHFPFSSVLSWYQVHGRHNLPWRQIYDKPAKERLYKVWIAEVMLQQTQVDRVIGYYTRFLEKYTTIESLAKTTYDELFPYYQGLGYYGRARRMIELAKVVVEKYDGLFPDDFEKLRKLPGVGQYTAKALLAFGYDTSVLAMDANLEKIFSRYYFGSRYFFSMKNEEGRMKNEGFVNDFQALVKDLESQLKKSIIEHPLLLDGRTINNALMDFGALVSTSIEKIDADNYPLRDCAWLLSEGKIEQEQKAKSKKQKDGGLKNLHKSSLAKLIVFLHENHKLYWSSVSSHYEPFLIEPTDKDDRRTIQDYFSATFGLEVSVRPSFGSGEFEGTPVKLFHAQIQTGTFKQKTFGKNEKEEWLDNYTIKHNNN